MLVTAPGSNKRTGKKAQMSAVLLLGFEVEISPQTEYLTKGMSFTCLLLLVVTDTRKKERKEDRV